MSGCMSGEKILVRDTNYKMGETILVRDSREGIWEQHRYIKDGNEEGVICVTAGYGEDYSDGIEFNTEYWKYHKKLPQKKYVPFTYEDRDMFRDKWVKQKGKEDVEITMLTITTDKIIVGFLSYKYKEAFEELEFINGSPFGKEVYSDNESNS